MREFVLTKDIPEEGITKMFLGKKCNIFYKERHNEKFEEVAESIGLDDTFFNSCYAIIQDQEGICEPLYKDCKYTIGSSSIEQL